MGTPPRRTEQLARVGEECLGQRHADERGEALRDARSERDAAEACMRSWTGPIDAGEFDEARLAFEWASARVAALEAA